MDTATGTTVRHCDLAAFDGLTERKVFQGLTKLSPVINEMFFARKVLLVEGPQDQIAVTAYLQSEGRIQKRIEELDWSVVVTGGKQAIPFFQMVLNAFGLPYVVLHDVDIEEGMDEGRRATQTEQNDKIASLANGNPIVTFPVKLETSLGLDHHISDQYTAHKFFETPENMTMEFKGVLEQVFA